MEGNDLIPLILIAPLLVFAGYSDLRHMRIPNFLSLAALALFVLTAPLLAWNELALRAVAGLIVFGLGFVAFMFGLFGGVTSN